VDLVSFLGYLIFYGAIVTYIVLGFIVAFEAMLALNGVPGAIEWIRMHHSPRTFWRMLLLFLPILHLLYLLFEVIPNLFGEPRSPFDLERIYSNVFGKDRG